jgi:SLT domain-containing protein
MAGSAEDRIEQALARIEKAAAARAYAAERLGRRHAVLRERIEAAIESLDGLIARESGGED